MPNNSELGKTGEALAARFLEELGFQVMVHNYRHGRAEIDLIVEKDQMRVFIEVKTRSGTGYGFPELAVSANKIRLFKAAAEHYLLETGWEYELRFDIIAILIRPGQKPEIEHLEDVFY